MHYIKWCSWLCSDVLWHAPIHPHSLPRGLPASWTLPGRDGTTSVGGWRGRLPGREGVAEDVKFCFPPTRGVDVIPLPVISVLFIHMYRGGGRRDSSSSTTLHHIHWMWVQQSSRRWQVVWIKQEASLHCCDMGWIECLLGQSLKRVETATPFLSWTELLAIPQSNELVQRSTWCSRNLTTVNHAEQTIKCMT